ncbi:MAG: GNAT family N-acetyltransferase [Polyangiaceae bacterium]|nr:GNAT family N-acetyltransferase [Polyangiaceae bacterium]
MTYTFVPELDERLVAEAASHTHEIWSGGFSLDGHIERTKDQLRRAGRDILRYVGLVDETGLVASIKRYGLVVHAPGVGPVPAIGIGAVYTRKDARRKGAAATLLRWLLEDARSTGHALALLYSEIGTAYYERLGFVALPSYEHAASAIDFPDATSLEIRPAGAADEELIIRLHEASWDPSVVRIVRTPEHLRYFRYRNTADCAWMLHRNGSVVGYLIAGIHDGTRDDGVNASSRTLWVDEWAAPGISTADVFGAIRVIAQRESAPRVAAWLSPWHAFPPFTATPRHDTIAMACPLNAPISTIDPHQTFFGSLDHF